MAKRAYRGNPQHGFCPNPEAFWGQLTMEQVLPLEELLRFFHVQCNHILREWTARSRLTLLGQVDIASTIAFYLVTIAKGMSKDKTQRHLRSGNACWHPPASMRIN